ncbi:unnamed protein product, partial [Polarella glacialis]
VLELGDRLVVHKPPGWQVDDGQDDPEGSSERDRLSSFLRSVLPLTGCPILGDTDFARGFVHRLDVPSSGLILVAKTYAAYYDLRQQQAQEQLVRDYVVLCHGWVCPERREIRARVHSHGKGRDIASSIAPGGRPAITWLKVLARVVLGGEALSLLVIRIATGRKHQIRLHSAHVGHPTVCDGKYTARHTHLADLTWCPRNFLHRYRLAFFADSTSLQCESQSAERQPQQVEVVEPLPPDLLSSLQVTTPLCAASAEALEDWLQPKKVQPKAWDNYDTLQTNNVLPSPG